MPPAPARSQIEAAMIGSGAITSPARHAVLQLPGTDVFRFRSRPAGKHRKIKLGYWRQPWLRVAGAGTRNWPVTPSIVSEAST